MLFLDSVLAWCYSYSKKRKHTVIILENEPSKKLILPIQYRSLHKQSFESSDPPYPDLFSNQKLVIS